jgi:hypothetical protein
MHFNRNLPCHVASPALFRSVPHYSSRVIFPQLCTSARNQSFLFVPRNEGTPAFVFFSSTNSAQKSALASELFILCSAEQFPHAPSSIVGFYTWHWITWRDPIRSLFVFFSLKRITCSRFSPPHFNNLKIFPSCSFVFLVVKSSNSFLSRLAAPAPPPRC